LVIFISFLTLCLDWLGPQSSFLCLPT
jgi:hypothetical protein